MEIPRGARKVWEFKCWLETQLSEIGCFGKEGRSVGIGFEWETRTGLGNGGLGAVCTLARRVQRAFLATGILSRQAETYLLRCKITYIRSGEPNAVLHLTEG